MSGAPDAVTVARSHRRRLTKLIQADGSVVSYDQTKAFDLILVNVAGFDGLKALLQRLAHRPDCAILRGAIANPARVKGVRRLLYPDKNTGDQPTLVDVPRQWLALDFDTLPRPAWINPEDLLGCACVAIQTLPAAFHHARFIIQATSGHGLKPGIRLRLWCWLSRSVSGAEATYWLRNVPVDAAVFRPAQLIYTASPIFAIGAFDPLPRRFDIFPGADAVAVPKPNRLKKPPPPRPAFDRDATGDWLGGLIRFVASATPGNRNDVLYWAACRAAERHADQHAAELLEDAAVKAGLSAQDAAATIASGWRHE